MIAAPFWSNIAPLCGSMSGETSSGVMRSASAGNAFATRSASRMRLGSAFHERDADSGSLALELLTTQRET